MRARGLSGAGAFFALLVTYGAFLAFTQGTWLLGGGVWAEGATNYWPNAHSPEWTARLFATDSGYIPLPQRLIALAGGAMPARLWPWWLSAASYIGACALVALFASRRFRPLVPDDRMRLLAAMALLLAMDFQTANFINFIYLATLPVAALTALAMCERPGSVAVPKWAWLVPLLCLSKPAVLAVVPAMLLAALRPDSRWRRITLATLLVAAVQLARMATSHAGGTMASHLPFTLAQKAAGAVTLAFGFLAEFTVPPLAPAAGKVVLGVVLAAGLGWIAWRGTAPVRALIICGALLVAGNMALVAFTLPDDWLAVPRLNGFDLMRQNMPALIGAALVVLGAVQTLPERLGLGVFAGWCLTLLLLAIPINARGWQTGLASQWQALGTAIDAGTTPLCVPVDPAGWVYGRGCRSLGAGYQPGLTLAYTGAATRTALAARPALSGRTLIAFGLMAKPVSMMPVRAQATLVLRDGRRVPLTLVASLPAGGGLAMFTTGSPLAAADVQQAAISFDALVVLGRYTVYTPGQPVTAWFGD